MKAKLKILKLLQFSAVKKTWALFIYVKSYRAVSAAHRVRKVLNLQFYYDAIYQSF